MPLSSISGSRQSQLELLPFGDSLREWAHRQFRCLKSAGVVWLLYYIILYIIPLTLVEWFLPLIDSKCKLKSWNGSSLTPKGL